MQIHSRFVAAQTSSRCRGLRRPGSWFAALLVTVLGCQEDVTAPTPPEAAPVLATAASALTFSQVSAGNVHSCGVTTDNRAYCWGDNDFGRLGTGSATGPETCTGAVGPFPCSTRPAPVAGGLRFRQISAGNAYTCGVTTGYRAYCWGWNGSGQLGDGTTGTTRLAPVPVAGGRQFSRVEVNLNHTCGLSYPDGRAYCWGINTYGQLGDGTTTQRRTPVAVSGTRSFHEVSEGWDHTCGVTTDDRAFCWGRNNSGQIGDSSTASRRLTPTRVGARHYRQLDTGDNHACAVADDHRAYCWGDGRGGQIGNGRAYLSFWPRLVSGGHLFDAVTAGAGHTCGETTTNRAYCWGVGGLGQLGDGTNTGQLKPVAVAGGLSFAQVSAGNDHTCGRQSSTNKAYCWGYNFFGELGDGTRTSRSTPTAVVGPA